MPLNFRHDHHYNTQHRRQTRITIPGRSKSIIGANIFKDLFAGLRDIVGGRSETYERVIEEARNNAMNEMVKKAQSLGGNAVIGIDLDFETVGASGSMLMVLATGTAVIV